MKSKMLRLSIALAGILIISNQAFAEEKKLINGAGATFPYPIYSKWFSEYTKVDSTVNFNYQSIGSGGGIKQISAQTVDFGASDAFLSNEQLRDAPGKLLHIPMVAGAVVVTYNLEGVSETLQLTPDLIADIFLGNINNWSDERLKSVNPNITFPDQPIIVAHRSDGSGTTSIFTDYLSSVSENWKSKVGKGTSVSWPLGLGGKGNEGVTGVVKQNPNAIGYVELSYAMKNRLPYASIQNKAGKFITPSIESTTAAIAGKLSTMPDDFRVSLVNPDGEDAYPIAGLTWILVYKKQPDSFKGQKIVEFLKWAIHDGQQYTKDLLYAPLPAEVVAKVNTKLQEISF